MKSMFNTKKILFSCYAACRPSAFNYVHGEFSYFSSLAVSSSPGHVGFLYDYTWEGLQQPEDSPGFPPGTAQFSPTILFAAIEIFLGTHKTSIK